MGKILRIPTPLRRFTGGEGSTEVNGNTIGQCLAELESRFPETRDRLFDGEGRLHHFVNIYINGEDVQFLQGLDTQVNEGDEVSIVPAVAGGDLRGI